MKYLFQKINLPVNRRQADGAQRRSYWANVHAALAAAQVHEVRNAGVDTIADDERVSFLKASELIGAHRPGEADQRLEHHSQSRIDSIADLWMNNDTSLLVRWQQS